MKFVCIILTFILCVFFGEIRADESCNITESTAEKGVIEFNPYPIEANVTCSSWIWHMNSDGGNVDVTVNYLELDATAQDYLIISPGSSPLGDSSIVLTGKIKSKKFRVMNDGSMFVRLTIQERLQDSGNLTGFKLSFAPYGTTAAPTSSTTPPTTLPTAPSEVESDAILYAANITAKELADKIDDFKIVMANMTDEFFANNGTELLMPTPSENVIIDLITVCPLGWPDWYKCVKIQLRIPVNVMKNSSYEMTGKHIREMWKKKGNAKMAPLGITVYKEPNADATMLVWVYIAAGTVLIFGAFLIVAWKLNVFNSNKKAKIPEFNPTRISDISIKSWISETTYEVPPMVYEDHIDKPPIEDHLTIPATNQDEGPRISGPYTATAYWPTTTANHNPAFDPMGEEIKDIDDFSSDEESSPQSKSHNTKSHQDHLYEAPRETDDGNYSEI